MKKTTLFFMVFIYAGISWGQKYVPFLLENAKWNEIHIYFNEYSMTFPDVSYVEYSFRGDTLINDIHYKKLYTKTTDYPVANYSYRGAMRESNKKIYFWDLDRYSPVNKSEIILYDFDVHLGQVITNGLSYGGKITGIDSTLIGDSYRKTFEIGYGSDYIVEGIGSISRGLLYSITPIPTCGCTSQYSVCYSENGETLYKNPKFMDCNASNLEMFNFYNPIFSKLGNTNRWTMLKNNEYMHSEEWMADKDTFLTRGIVSNIKYKKVRRIEYNGNRFTHNEVNWRDYTPTSIPVYEKVLIRPEDNFIDYKIYMLDLITNKEYLISDASLQTGDTFLLPGKTKELFHAEKDLAIVDSVYTKYGLKHVRLNVYVNYPDNTKLTFIEGVGPNVGLLYAWDQYQSEWGFVLNGFKSEYLFYRNPLTVRFPLGFNSILDKVDHVSIDSFHISVTDNEIHIRFDNEAIKQITIYDMMGRIYYKGDKTNNIETVIPKMNLPKGIYMLRIENADTMKARTEKLMLY